MSDYSVKHWSKRIPEYLAADWSDEPTPFAKQAADYFAPGGKVLELGAGGGMDSLWFASQGFDVTMTDAMDFGLTQLKTKAMSKNLNIDVLEIDMYEPFPLQDNSFDAVYSQLAIHYFGDQATAKIMEEVSRVLKPGGIFACMVNSTKDPEYDPSLENDDHLVPVGDLMKRYFTLGSFKPFVNKFELILFDEAGSSPKDDSVGTKGMIRFIGKQQ